MSDDRCPKCGKAYPFGDPRQLVAGRQCFECDEAEAPPGHLWEFAEDRCRVCGILIGMGVRFLHLGLCDTCKAAPTH